LKNGTSKLYAILVGVFFVKVIFDCLVFVCFAAKKFMGYLSDSHLARNFQCLKFIEK
jgi:hypothetical protein